jgi:outer membrane protein assembly factor BamB
MWAKYRGGMMLQVNPEGKILRQFSDPLAHHDQNHLDDGTLLYTTLEPLSESEAARVQGGITGSEAPNGIVYGDCIKLVDPWRESNSSSSADFSSEKGAKLLWSWRAIDHLDPAVFAAHPHYPREHWPLINSVSFDSEGNIIASSRNASSVFVISRKTGEVLWHLASPVVSQQHCAHQINESGDMLIFDNGVFREGISVPFSRAIVVSKEKVVKWEYKDPSTGGLGFFTPFMGSAQKLAGGNVLLCEAADGRIMEVTEGGEMVWEFVVPQLGDYKAVMGKNELEEMERIGFDYLSNAVFRAYKYRPEEVPWLKEKKKGSGWLSNWF